MPTQQVKVSTIYIMTSISRRQRRKSTTNSNNTTDDMKDIVSPIATPSAQRKNTTEQQMTFPYKLFQMLEYACDSEFSSACYWAEDGSAFVIRNKTVMMKELVPKFFNQTKYRSFVSCVCVRVYMLCHRM